MLKLIIFATITTTSLFPFKFTSAYQSNLCASTTTLCLYYYNEAGLLSLSDAQNYCSKQGYKLLEIKNGSDQSEINRWVSIWRGRNSTTLNKGKFWLNAYKNNTKFYWNSTGNEMKYEYWKSDEPNINSVGIIMDCSGYWNCRWVGFSFLDLQAGVLCYRENVFLDFYKPITIAPRPYPGLIPELIPAIIPTTTKSLLHFNGDPDTKNVFLDFYKPITIAPRPYPGLIPELIPAIIPTTTKSLLHFNGDPDTISDIFNNDNLLIVNRNWAIGVSVAIVFINFIVFLNIFSC